MTASRHIEGISERASGLHPGAFLRLVRVVPGAAQRVDSGVRVLVAALFVCCCPFLVSCSVLSGFGQGRIVADESDGRIESAPSIAVPMTRERGVEDTLASSAGSAVETPTEADGPLMRVGLIEHRSEVRISCAGLCSIVLYGETTVRATGESAEWTFRAEGRGFHVAGPGVNTVIGGTARVAPLSDDAVAVDGTAYRGEVEVFLSRDGGLSVVNVVGLESYLRGVVPREIGPRQLSDLEAVKAQAVAARTYALARGGGRSAGDYDLYATVDDQAYGGVAVEDPTSDRAVAETAGLVLYHENAPINAYFSSCCGGWTAAREDVWELPGEPHLIAQSDVPGGGRNLEGAYCSGSPNFTWEVEWSGDEILDLVQTRLRETASAPVLKMPSAVRNIRITDRTGQGRVKWLEVETPEGTYTVFADRVRWLLRRPGSDSILRSAWFDLEVDRGGGRVTRVKASGRGYGHGVGLCQHGALGMARRGFTFRQILEHYYPGTGLESPAAYRE